MKLAKSNFKNVSELEQKKRKIKAELVQIQMDLDSTVSRATNKVVSSVIPTDKIREKPFRSLAIAVTAGFLLGLRKSGERRRKSRRISEPHASKQPGLTSMVADELKRYAARRSVAYILHNIDTRLSSRFFSDSDEKPEK